LEVLKFRDQASPYNPHRLDFDGITFLSARGESLDPAAAPAPFAGAPTLDNLGVNIHFTRDDVALDALKGSGIAWLRMDLYWSGIEKAKGVYDFSADDALVASAVARGLKVHFILGYANPLYESGPPRSAAAIAGVHAGNPAAHVSTGGVSEFDWPFVGKILAAGGSADADAIGVHPYRGDVPEALIDQILLLKTVVRDAYGKSGAPTPPLWDT